MEDELVIASLIADMLRSIGMLVKIALSAQSGLLHAQRETFDLVICDLQMPGLDGRNFLAGLQESGNPLCERILFITGDAQAADKQEFLRKNHAVWPSRLVWQNRTRQSTGCCRPKVIRCRRDWR